MPPIFPQPFNGAPLRSGFSIAVSESKAGQFIRIGLSAAAQELYFGGVLKIESDGLVLELSDVPKDNHLMEVELAGADDPQALPITGGIKGSLSVKLMPWCQIAAGKRSAAELQVVSATAGKSVSLKLPEWARPALVKIGQGKPIMEI